MDILPFTHEQTQMNRKGQQIFQQLEMLNLITEKKSCREASCQTRFTMNTTSQVKVSRHIQYKMIIINPGSKNVQIINIFDP